MKLETYISDNDLTHEAFGKLVGATQVTINRYVNGKRFPSRDMMRRIHEATEGQVTVSDWFEMEVQA
ncbi:helix-turn-helix transcriptional regulator [Ensifer sp. PDNC004]|nr:helix-turn-helix transcriptional regulator [Ensifer sp. PDNC004]